MHKVSPPVKAVRCCTGHEPLGSVVVRLFGNAGAQLGKDFLFGFRAGVKLAQALVGLTDIVESGVDTVQFHTSHPLSITFFSFSLLTYFDIQSIIYLVFKTI